jgi:DNA-binding NtrC family response regulator
LTSLGGNLEKQSKRKTVMIVDDDLDNLQLFKDILQYGGFETYDFNNPKLALEVFKEDPDLYDIILTDIRMEEMDGRLLYKEIKYLRPKANVLVFTAFELNGNDFRKICPTFKEDHLIHKPIRMDSLVEKVRNTIFPKLL